MTETMSVADAEKIAKMAVLLVRAWRKRGVVSIGLLEAIATTAGYSQQDMQDWPIVPGQIT